MSAQPCRDIPAQHCWCAFQGKGASPIEVNHEGVDRMKAAFLVRAAAHLKTAIDWSWSGQAWSAKP